MSWWDSERQLAEHDPEPRRRDWRGWPFDDPQQTPDSSDDVPEDAVVVEERDAA